jgi:hypothetical protein
MNPFTTTARAVLTAGIELVCIALSLATIVILAGLITGAI